MRVEDELEERKRIFEMILDEEVYSIDCRILLVDIENRDEEDNYRVMVEFLYLVEGDSSIYTGRKIYYRESKCLLIKEIGDFMKRDHSGFKII